MPNNRLEKLREKLSSYSADTLLVTDKDNIRYLTGFTGSFGFAIISSNCAVFITDSRYVLQAKQQCGEFEVVSWNAPQNFFDALSGALSAQNITTLGFESHNVTVSQLEHYEKKLNGISLKPVKNIISDLRLIKDLQEIELIRNAANLADALYDYLQLFLQIGAVEYDVSLEIEFFLRRQGAGIAFPPIVVSGNRSARPHGEPSEKQFERGDFVTMDFGAKLNGYNSDITRTVVIGAASDRHKEVYNAVLEAQLASLDAMKPGVKCSDVDKTARTVLANYGLEGYFQHGLGHSLGLAVHDGGGLNQSSELVLETGQVWTVEPGVYIEGFGGVRIEDDVVVTEQGIEILTHSPKELMIIDR